MKLVYSKSVAIVFCLIAGVLACTTTLKAQNYAVSSTVQLLPPYSVYLSDYATLGNGKLRVILQQGDLSRPVYQLRLVMTVELNGRVIMRTSRFFNPAPITLDPGVPTVIHDAELAPYVDSRNIDFIGYSKEQYEKTKALPEGSYQITFTAYDYRRQDQQVSNAGSAFYYLAKNEAPLVNYPSCGSKIPVKTPQQIVFSWLPRNTSSPTSAQDTEYEFTLYETRPEGRNPNDVVLTSQPVFRLRTDYTQIIYGPAEPMLLDNMVYVWRVQAIDRSGKDAFRNNGYSEVCTFKYGGTDPNFDIGIVKGLQAIGETDQRAKVWWEPGNFDAYRVYYKKPGDQWQWFYNEVTKPEFKIFDLEPDNEYEVRVQGKKNGYYSPYTEVVKFRTKEKQVAQCGDPAVKAGEGEPLLHAYIGMTFMASGEPVTITEIEPLGNGWFKGYGRAVLHYLGATYEVKFDRLYITENLEAGDGEMNVVTEGFGAMAVALKEATQLKNTKAWAGTNFYDQIVSFDYVINYITVDASGDLLINKENGQNVVNTEVPVILAKNPDKAIITQDSKGEQFVIQKKEGQTTVTRVRGGGLSPSQAIDITQLDDLEKLIVEVLKDYTQQTAAYKASQGQKNPAKGGGPSLFDFEWRRMIADALPECFQPYKDDLDVIENKLKDITSSTQKVKSFAARVKEKLKGVAKPKKADVEVKVCEAIIEDLPIDIPTDRTYLTPVGTPITLTGKHEINSICGSATAFPDGTLLNFTIGGKTYIAKFEKLGPPRFYGYYEFANNQYGDVYTDPNTYKTGKTDIVFIQRTVEGGKATGKLYLGEYTIADTKTNQQIAGNGGLPIRIDAIILPDQKANTRSYSVTFNCPVTPLDEYLATKNNRIQKWLSAKGIKADLYFSDCATGTATHITETNVNAQTSADAKAEFDKGAFSNDVAIWACWDGKKWDIKHKYKSGALNPSNGKIKAELSGIEKEIDNRVDKLIQKAGTGTTTASAEIKYSYGDDGELYRESMDLFQLIVTVKDFGKTLVNYAKVPEPTWNSQEKAAEYNKYPVHVPPMLAGSGDQVLNELTGAIQFVNFGLDMVTEPELAKQTWQQLAGLTPETVKKLIVDAAESKVDIYAKGGVIARHEAGADVVTVVVAASAAYKILKDGHELVSKSGKKGKEMAEQAEEVAEGAAKKLGNSIDDDAVKNLTDARKRGEIYAEDVEKITDEAKDAAATKKRKLTWEEVKALFKRGNDFNKKGYAKYGFENSEIVLENGKRVDAYIPGERIISRKATDLDNIQESTWRNYCKELTTKYKIGTSVKSTKMPGEAPLNGKYYIEIPASNQTAKNLASFKKIAKTEFGIEDVIFLVE